MHHVIKPLVPGEISDEVPVPELMPKPSWYNLKAFIGSILSASGIEFYRNRGKAVGKVGSFFRNLRALGFNPRGMIDVGANRGDWTRLARSIFPTTPVIMIEPQTEMQFCLSRFASQWTNVYYVKAGAGRHCGEAVQTIWPDLAGSSFLPEPDPEQLASGRQRLTRLITLDALLNEVYPHFVPDIIKLDIQGFELEALSGAESTFGRTELFIVETALFHFSRCTPLARDIIVFMAQRGYELYDVTGYQRRPFDGALGQIDLAFVQAQGRFRSEIKW